MSLRFGAFLAPHHLMGESPTLQLQRDLDLVEHLDRLGYDEFWCGEHHSTGWETIASPEMFLAAAAVRTHRIGLGTGVTSIPYHHPFHVAQKIVQLDHMSRGRAILGTGPGALPSDAHTLGIDPMVLRDRQDEAIPVIQRLLAGAERFSYESEWFTLRDAALQILPYQRDVHMTTASMVSPSGMTLAGKHGLGVLSLGSMSTAGLASLPLQWSFAEEAAEQSGRVVDRANWRIVFSSHVAETREQARAEVEHGLLRWHNEYNVGTLQRPGLKAFASTAEAIEFHANPESSAGVIGTPDDLITNIRRMQDITGGFGMVLNFAHDWANPEASNRSWDLIARHVIPEINGQIEPMRASNTWVRENRESFTRAGEAIMSKIAGNARAVAALANAGVGSQSITPHVALDDDPTAAS
ncbi:MAG: LLM class flavin-dependent oxidoreductase [Acidimicrobiales bacterium]|jgi:limonene 1,2-monooxygenase|nr:LLM class flavin-dependent oxidoreductase [Acidimicrobiales bacterium]MDG2219676.1 LLM class flavin-dependent oxidoreductase [Acidimicrobiales bacterium]